MWKCSNVSTTFLERVQYHDLLLITPSIASNSASGSHYKFVVFSFASVLSVVQVNQYNFQEFWISLHIGWYMVAFYIFINKCLFFISVQWIRDWLY